MACNSIHHLALIEYLTDNEVATLDWAEPPVIRDAKRPGYMELTGSLRGQTRTGVDFTVSSIAGSMAALEVTVETASRAIVVDEAVGTQSEGGQTAPRPFDVLMASQLAPVFRQILTESRSMLPDYDRLVSPPPRSDGSLQRGFLWQARFVGRMSGYLGSGLAQSH